MSRSAKAQFWNGPFGTMLIFKETHKSFAWRRLRLNHIVCDKRKTLEQTIRGRWHLFALKSPQPEPVQTKMFWSLLKACFSTSRLPSVSSRARVWNTCVIKHFRHHLINASSLIKGTEHVRDVRYIIVHTKAFLIAWQLRFNWVNPSSLMDTATDWCSSAANSVEWLLVYIIIDNYHAESVQPATPVVCVCVKTETPLTLLVILLQMQKCPLGLFSHGSGGRAGTPQVVWPTVWSHGNWLPANR